MPSSSGDNHPFVISSALDVSFGYAPVFLAGKIVWDLHATSGGGRHPPDVTLAKMKELGELTRDGAPLAGTSIMMQPELSLFLNF